MPEECLRIAVVGSGIAGLSAAWLLSQRHHMTLYEKNDYAGGHSNTTEAAGLPVDTGFIVYNDATYPNLTAMFAYLNVETLPSDMSFAVSARAGRVEYSGSDLAGLFAQWRNLARPGFWSMIRDILRFYREAPKDLITEEPPGMTLGAYLTSRGYSDSFINEHLLPMGAAIWSTPASEMLNFPLAAFVKFFENHGLLNLDNRPIWRTVRGGSREYVAKMKSAIEGGVRLNAAVKSVRDHPHGGAVVETRDGATERYDHVVIGAHADQALAMLPDARPAERKLLGAFSYQRNLAVLHSDPSLMPRNRRVWSSWNYLGGYNGDPDAVSVSYWMNRLQSLPGDRPLFVTLNPTTAPGDGHVLRSFLYDHPVFDQAAFAAQRLLWNIHGNRNIWFCGSYFGHGFHEDALQSGLAVAERLGGVRRPWQVAGESARIFLLDDETPRLRRRAA